MIITEKTILVTGANRGIGQALSKKRSAGTRSGCMPARVCR